GRQLLESMQQWGERVYRTFGRGMPMFGNEIIRDMEVLRKEGEEKAEECLTVHIEKLRCKLGSLVKGNLQHTQNSMLTLLAEIRLCLIGFERFSGQKFRTGEGASVSEEGKANAAVSADAGGSDLAKMPCTPREEALLTGLSPKPDPASEEAAHRAVVRLTEALKPYTTKKNFRLNQVRSEQAEADIDTVFEWAYRLLLRKAERPYVRSQACQAEIDRIGRYECSMTREVFVKACQSVIGALGNVGSFWGETAEGTLMTLMDRLEIIKEWLALDCAEPF
ncbi:MAG: hypothetical protein ACI4SV_06735, partial [Duodenibacillus sp.]